MATKHTRTARDQAFWDAVFLATYPECIKAFVNKGGEYCAHLAREQADAALAERRLSAKGDAK